VHKFLNLILLKRIYLRKVTNSDVDNFDKAAVLGRTSEVPLAFHAAVIFSTRLIEFHSNPRAWFEMNISCKKKLFSTQKTTFALY
jgi:hypothetical protein